MTARSFRRREPWLARWFFFAPSVTPVVGGGPQAGPPQASADAVVFDPEPSELQAVADTGRSMPRQPIVAIARTGDGKTLALAAEDATIRVVDATNGRVRFVLNGAGTVATCLVFSPDGALLASGGPD